MAEIRNRQRWAHTSSLMALIFNMHADLKKVRAAQPADFDPFAEDGPPGTPITADNIHDLKDFL